MANALATFNDDPECRAFLLQAGASAAGSAATGLTLNAANHVILVDVLTDAMVELQCVNRVHRIGQKRQTKVSQPS